MPSLARYNKWLLLSFMFLVVAVPAGLYAINTVSEGFRVGSTTTQIDAHGICKNVTSTGGIEYFVPTKTSGEWTTFLGNVPTGVTVADCTACLPNSRVATPFYPPSPACALTNTGQARCWNISTGASVSGVPTTTFSAIEIAGDDTVCGITTAGAVQCFRSGAYGAVNRPTTGTFVDIDNENTHTCALRDDGQVRCWGRYLGFMAGDYGLAFSPAGTFKAIGVGATHACGVRTNDTVACWGGYDVPSATYLAPLQYKGLVSLNFDYALCGLNSAGKVFCANPGYTPPGFGSYTGSENFSVIEGMCGIKKSDGRLLCPGVAAGIPVDSFISIDTHLSFNSLFCGVTTAGVAKCWNIGSAMTLTPPAGPNFSCS